MKLSQNVNINSSGLVNTQLDYTRKSRVKSTKYSIVCLDVNRT